MHCTDTLPGPLDAMLEAEAPAERRTQPAAPALSAMMTAARERYRALVFAIVEGRQPDEEELLRTLVAVARSIEQLERDVSAYRSRMHDLEEVEDCRRAGQQARELKPRMTALERQIADERAAFQQRIAPQVAELQRLKCEHQELDRQARSSGQALGRLHRSADPALHAQADEIGQRRAALTRGLSQLRAGHPIQTEPGQFAAVRDEKAIAAAEAELSAIVQQQDAVGKQMQELQAWQPAW